MLLRVKESVIASGDTESDLVDLENVMIVGLIIPTIDNGTLTFKVAARAIDTPVLLKSKALTALTVSASTGGIAIGSDDLDELSAYRYVQIVAGAAQTAERTFTWVTKVWTP